jgi:hypothetical protein
MSKKKAIPKGGRKRSEVVKDLGLHAYSGDVPLGNNNPTMVEGILWGHGGVPNRPPRGSLKPLKEIKN